MESDPTASRTLDDSPLMTYLLVGMFVLNILLNCWDVFRTRSWAGIIAIVVAIVMPLATVRYRAQDLTPKAQSLILITAYASMMVLTNVLRFLR